MTRVLVLCYHAVSEGWPAPLAVHPRRLERQLAFLVERGYRGRTFHDAIEGGSGEKTLVVTFDDAYASIRRHAFPILSGLGLPATVFVPTAFAGSREPMSWPGVDHWGEGEYGEELRPLRWEELAELAGAGWEIGSHTRTHPRLTELDDRDLDDELGGSRADCEERIGRPCRSVAYPYGAADERVIAAAAAAGYSAGATLSSELPAPRRMRWPRVGVYRRDGSARFRLKVSPRVRRLRGTRAWRLIDGRGNGRGALSGEDGPPTV
jgi:peptidoglycan/xylan/chitin deacetylase (PgdA/CDA1 family)